LKKIILKITDELFEQIKSDLIIRKGVDGGIYTKLDAMLWLIAGSIEKGKKEVEIGFKKTKKK